MPLTAGPGFAGTAPFVRIYRGGTLLWEPGGAVTFGLEAGVGQLTGTPAAPGNPYATIQVPITADSDLVLVAAMTESTDYTAAPTIAGQAMTLIGQARAGTAPFRGIRHWVAIKSVLGANWPAVGNAALVVTPDTNVAGVVSYSVLKAALQAAPTFYGETIGTTDGNRTLYPAAAPLPLTGQQAGSFILITALSNRNALPCVTITTPAVPPVVTQYNDLMPPGSVSSHVGHLLPADVTAGMGVQATANQNTPGTICATEVRPAP